MSTNLHGSEKPIFGSYGQTDKKGLLAESWFLREIMHQTLRQKFHYHTIYSRLITTTTKIQK